MRKIFKYPLEVADLQQIEIPFGYKLLTCQFQHGQLCLWAEVNPDAMKVKTTIAIFGTGNPIPTGLFTYIATVQEMGGNLVWHVYESK